MKLVLGLSVPPVSRYSWHWESIWLLILSRPLTAWLQIGQVTAMVSHAAMSCVEANLKQYLEESRSQNGEFPKNQLGRRKKVVSKVKFEIAGDAFAEA